MLNYRNLLGVVVNVVILWQGGGSGSARGALAHAAERAGNVEALELRARAHAVMDAQRTLIYI